IEWDTVIEEVLGIDTPKSVTGLRLKNVKSDNVFDVSVDGLFVAIGHHPNTEIFKHQLHLDDNGYIVTKHDSTQTNIEGVFAADDVMNPHFRQAVIAAGSGCLAALEAEKFLSENQ
ncbi:MAG: FAD-dependent oxidoreductase, partial [Alphaproteobacteria bacterium]|nr:FAD-dependent oxidoreductase [Alphaproteobacteria bacterium]